MATAEAQLDLEKLVAQPTWRDELRLMVEQERLDPWNIDIGEIADRFIGRIRKMQTLDLLVPANLILAASILLYLKSASLRFEEEQGAAQETYIEEERPPVEIPVLTLRTRMPPKRKVTLAELVQALEDAFAYQSKREAIEIPESISFQLPAYDIGERMEHLLAKISAGADAEGFVTFNWLLEERTQEGVILTLLPLLHLAQDGKIDIFQERMFGEIFVRALKPGDEVKFQESKEEPEEGTKQTRPHNKEKKKITA